MNRKIAALVAAGALVLGVGAVGVNSAVANGSTQPSSNSVPSVTTATAMTSTTSLHRSASTHKSALPRQAMTKKAGVQKTLPHRSGVAAQRVQQAKVGAQMKANAKKATAHTRIHGKMGAAPAKTSTRMNRG